MTNVKKAPRKGVKRRKQKRVVRKRAATCLEPDKAIALLERCLGDPLPDLETPLEELFPSTESRRQYCRCIADSVSATFPCKAATTLQEIVDAISC
jgi:hypothetical protein